MKRNVKFFCYLFLLIVLFVPKTVLAGIVFPESDRSYFKTLTDETNSGSIDLYFNFEADQNLKCLNYFKVKITLKNLRYSGNTKTESNLTYSFTDNFETSTDDAGNQTIEFTITTPNTSFSGSSTTNRIDIIEFDVEKINASLDYFVELEIIEPTCKIYNEFEIKEVAKNTNNEVISKVAPGEEFYYVVEITPENNGFVPDPLKVKIQLPDEVEYISTDVSISPSAYTGFIKNLIGKEWKLSGLSPGKLYTIEVSYKVKLKSDISVSEINSSSSLVPYYIATVAGSEFEMDRSDKLKTATLALAVSDDSNTNNNDSALSLTTSVNIDTVKENSSFTYTIKVKNNGDTSATADIKNVVDAHLNVISVETDKTYSNDGNTYRFNPVSLNPNEEATIKINVKALNDLTGVSQIINTTVLSEADKKDITNTLKNDVNTEKYENLKAEISIDKTEAVEGDTVVYTIKVVNTGDLDIKGVEIVDTFNEYLELLEYEGATKKGNTFTWIIDLNAKESKDLIIKAKVGGGVKVGDVIKNSATITYGSFGANSNEIELKIKEIENTKTGNNYGEIIFIMGSIGVVLLVYLYRKNKVKLFKI